MNKKATHKRSWSGLPITCKILFKKQLGKLKLRRSEIQQPIQKHEYRVISQHREDGIIDHLIETVAGSNKTFVELGFWPDECNCLNLYLGRSYQGLFIDGDPNNCARARAAFQWIGKNTPTITEAFITTENINQLICDAGISGEIDVLSIDIDGNDYWVWESINVVNPRIVVIEYNATFGKEKSITVPYEVSFRRYEKHLSGFYHGASLAALEQLGRNKGYQLVGCDFTGVNAFFVRDDLITAELEAMTVTNAFVENRGRVKYKGLSTEQQFEQIKDLPFIDVADNYLRE